MSFNLNVELVGASEYVSLSLSVSVNLGIMIPFILFASVSELFNLSETCKSVFVFGSSVLTPICEKAALEANKLSNKKNISPCVIYLVCCKIIIFLINYSS
ncbi:hypothetical protein [Chishuiella sp.]|uniref:hypothetical protein n=1 Tax=Chishuiella sp. TaxID=1969467 RepID=UPI0028A9FB1C|nr:hypothetical protein [Chishuiella sp.]